MSESPTADPTAEPAPADAAAKSKPIATFRHRSIRASVFENRSQTGGTYHAVSVQKRYKPERGEWQTTTNFLRDELPVLMELVRQAYAFILEHDHNRSPEAQ